MMRVRSAQNDRLRRGTSFADAGVGAATVTYSHDGNDLVRTRSIRHQHSDRIKLVERPDVVFVRERHVDQRAGGSDLRVRGNDRLATANRGAHRLAELGMQNGGGML